MSHDGLYEKEHDKLAEKHAKERTMSDEWKEIHKTSNNSGKAYHRAPQAQGVDVESLKKSNNQWKQGIVFSSEYIKGYNQAIDHLHERGLLGTQDHFRDTTKKVDTTNTSKQTKPVCITSDEEVYKEAFEWTDDALHDIDTSRVKLRRSNDVLYRAERCINTIRQALSMAIKEK